MKISQNKLGQDLGVPPLRINEIVQGKRGITADTALRLARYFNMSPQFWLGLQMDFELGQEADHLASRTEKGSSRLSGCLGISKVRTIWGLILRLFGP